MHSTDLTHIFAQSSLQIAAHHASTEWEWYVIRASGFVAAGLLILLMISGIGQVTGLTYRVIEPVRAWTLHKSLAFALCGSVLVHGTFLFLDHYISFSLPQLLIPFLSHYTNGTKLFGTSLNTLGVAFGILATYGIIITVGSSLNLIGWIDTKKRTWKNLHIINYLVVLFVFLHALSVGSDLRYGLFRSAWIFVGLLLTLLIVSRLLRVGTLRMRKTPESA